MPSSPSWDSATISEPSRGHSRQRPEDVDGGGHGRSRAGADDAITAEGGHGYQRAHRAGQQPPDPATVFRRRSPVPQVQHDHADRAPCGERVDQPGGDRLQRAGGGQEERAGHDRLPGFREEARGRGGAGHHLQHWYQHGHRRRRPEHPPLGRALRHTGREQPDQPDSGDEAGEARPLPGQRDDPRGRRAAHQRQDGIAEAHVQQECRTGGEQPGPGTLARPAERQHEPDGVEGPRSRPVPSQRRPGRRRPARSRRPRPARSRR